MTKEDVKVIETDCELTLKELAAAAGGLDSQSPRPLLIGREPGLHYLNPQPLPPG